MIDNSTKTSCLLCQNKSACFEKLSEEELLSVDERRVELHYRKGEVIAKQGSFVTHILFLKKGLTKIYREIDKDNNLILNFYPSGKLMGLSSLYMNSILQFSIAAVEDSVICAMDIHIFEKFVRQNGQFAASIIHAINQHFAHRTEKLVSLTQKQMNGRLAEAFLFFADQLYKSDSFHLSLTRKDIAEFTGMSVMSVVRGIKDFKENGILEDNNGDIALLRRDMLEKISQTG